MRILIVEPDRVPYEKEIAPTLGAMQEVVGGTIQAVYPFEEPVALVCNDDGKLLGLPLNRALYEPTTGQLYDVIAGTFFLCGTPPNGETFSSLSTAEIQKFSKRFCRPEAFVRFGRTLIPVPMGKTDRG